EAGAGVAQVPERARRRPSEEMPCRAGLAGRRVEPERAAAARRGSDRPLPERRRSDTPCPGELLEDSQPEPGDLGRSTEEPGVPGDAVHHPAVVAVPLAGAGRLAGERLPAVLLSRRRRPGPEGAGGRERIPAPAARVARVVSPDRQPVEVGGDSELLA